MNSPKTMMVQINPPKTIIIKIARLPIRLGQFLKHAGIVQNGVEAKEKIRDGEVYVNGQLELKRGRQLGDGDQISTGNSSYAIENIK